MGNRILVVDDEKLIVKGIRFSLEKDGMEVDCAYDGEEALELAKQNEYDVVLLDLMLPVYDGYEVCQRIREFSDMPIIMLTAKGDDMDKILGLEYGADEQQGGQGGKRIGIKSRRIVHGSGKPPRIYRGEGSQSDSQGV